MIVKLLDDENQLGDGIFVCTLVVLSHRWADVNDSVVREHASGGVWGGVCTNAATHDLFDVKYVPVVPRPPACLPATRATLDLRAVDD